MEPWLETSKVFLVAGQFATRWLLVDDQQQPHYLCYRSQNCALDQACLAVLNFLSFCYSQILIGIVSGWFMNVLQLLKLCHVEPQACICIQRSQMVRVKAAVSSDRGHWSQVSMHEEEEPTRTAHLFCSQVHVARGCFRGAAALVAVFHLQLSLPLC